MLHVKIWSKAEWQTARAEYLRELKPRVKARRARRSRGEKDPVEDFLWEYYSLRGGRLLSWSPGIGTVLSGATPEDFPDDSGFRQAENGREVDTEQILRRRQSGIQWILSLLRQIQNRPPVFHCLGLHEWAMVYEQEDIRHPQLGLRLPHAEVRKVVDSFPLQCTHYDAFRFFSRSARPQNQTTLSPESRLRTEQPGCLHANMDLFKWCMKLQPLVSSELTLKAFRLADRAREVDMRASPYDIAKCGLKPIRIERAEGRKEYLHCQQQIADDAAPIRQELIGELESIGA